jgi:hypothetical protein
VEQRRLVSALSTTLPQKLAEELVEEFMTLRRDFSTKTFGRGAPGKFVETAVQCFQHLGHGSYDDKPSVDDYLNSRLEGEKNLPEGLRLCAGRIARSMYTLRNKRNIAHKGDVDPNNYDLAFLHQAASWMLAEFLRHATSITMTEAGALIAQIQAPIDELVEDIEGIRLVHADVSLEDEIKILLRSVYPEKVLLASIKLSLVGRHPGTLGNKLRELVDRKEVFGDSKAGYRLTLTGFKSATERTRGLSISA